MKSDGVDPGRGTAWRPGSAALPVAVLSAFSGGVAVLLSLTLFPYLSVDSDEAIYRLHADALAHGHWFVPADGNGLPQAFQPWLSAIAGDRYVLKYSFVVPSILALSQRLTGATWLALGAVAAATVVMTYLLAREVLSDARQALLASLLVALSPLVVMQSALLLPYLPTLLFFETFAWGLLRGASSKRCRFLVLGGLGMGLAFAVRPYDTLLLAAPLLLWVWGPRARRPDLGHLVAFISPVAVGVVGVLGWNLAATGHPMRFPFSLLEPQDTLGFGVRRLYPTDAAHHFGPGEGLLGVVRHGTLLLTWMAGGLILLVVALMALVRQSEGALRALAAGAGALVFGYFFFWGPWNASVLWGGTRYVGPFYFLPLVVPAAFLGARGLTRLYGRNALAAVIVFAAMVLATAAIWPGVLADNAAHTRSERSLARLLAAPQTPKLVLARMPSPFLMAPTAVIANRWDLSGPIVFAIERPETDLEVVRLFPDRTVYRLRFTGAYRSPGERLTAQLEELRPVSAPRLDLRLAANLGRERRLATLIVTASGLRRSYSLGSVSGDHEERLVVTPGGAELANRVPVLERVESRPSPGLSVVLELSRASGKSPALVERERVALRTVGGTVEALVPTGRVRVMGSPPRPVLEIASRD